MCVRFAKLGFKSEDQVRKTLIYFLYNSNVFLTSLSLYSTIEIMMQVTNIVESWVKVGSKLLFKDIICHYNKKRIVY